jgi:hypothetical protein
MGTLIQSYKIQFKDYDTSHRYLSPLLAFASTYNQTKAHNMLAIMLDPLLQEHENHMGFCGQCTCAIQIVTNYLYINIVVPLLLHVFFHLNHVRVATIDELTIIENDDFFLGRLDEMMM